MASDTVEIVTDAKDYFSQQIEQASTSLSASLSQDSKTYLADLLFQFIDPKKFSNMLGSDNVLDSSLFDILKLAEESEHIAERLELLKCLGDVSLYISGFFQESFNRKLFDIGYYIDMGSMAYEGAARLSHESTFAKRYDELGREFGRAVDIVAEVADRTKSESGNNQDILAIYDRWNRSKSERLMKILIDAGINPIEVKTRLTQ